MISYFKTKLLLQYLTENVWNTV